MEYLFLPFILVLMVILVYSYIKKRILRDENEDLEDLKLLQKLLDRGTMYYGRISKEKNYFKMVG